MKPLDELRKEPLTYPVEKWAKWRFEHDNTHGDTYASFLLYLIMAEISRGSQTYGDIEPEWDVLWVWQRDARLKYKKKGILDTAACYIILDQCFLLSYDGDLRETGLFDRIPD